MPRYSARVPRVTTREGSPRNATKNPLIAPQVYEAALAALNGETLPKWIPSIEGVFYMVDPNLKEIASGRKY